VKRNGNRKYLSAILSITTAALTVFTLLTGVFPTAPLPVSAEDTPVSNSGNGTPESDNLSSDVHEGMDFGLDDLSNGADAIVKGTVIEEASYWNNEHTGIFTTTVLSVDETLKGSITDETVLVTCPGGEVDGMRQWVSSSPIFSEDEQVVVFLNLPIQESNPPEESTLQTLEETPIETYEVYGDFRGKYDVSDDMAGDLPLSEFQQRVESVLDGQQLTSAEQEIPSEPIVFSFAYTGFCWPHPPNPNVSFYVNENTPDCTGEASAVNAAASTWNNAGAKFAFSYAGSTSASAYSQNFINEIMWRNLGSGGTIAHVMVWSTGSTIVECDMEFNEYYLWSTAASPPGDRMDVQTLGLHEFGHFLCLDDLYSGADSDKVMYGYGSTGQSKRTLTSDDIAGIKAIYGTNIVVPTLSNTGGSNITHTSVRLNGNLSATGGENPNVIIYWGPSDGGVNTFGWASWASLGYLSSGTFYVDLSIGLTAGTTYYYRCYASNSAGGAWASASTSFTTTPYSLTMAVNGSGSVSPSVGSHNYIGGTVVTITATPAAGYTFINWTGNTGTIADVNSATSTVTMNGDYTITANFAQPVLTIASGGHGTVNPTAGPHTYNAGQTVSITAMPDTNYIFVNWTGNVGTIANVSSNETTIIMNGSYSITANFARPVLTLLTIGNGTILQTSGQAYDRDTVVSVNATADTGWFFVNWTGSGAGALDNASAASTNLTMTTHYTLTANFDQPTLTMATNPVSSGIVIPAIGSHDYLVGDNVTITAVNTTNWSFVNWSSNVWDINAATTNTTMEQADKTVTANFTRTRSDLTVIAGTGGTTTPTGTTNYIVSDNVTITATANSGYHFVNWTGDTGTMGSSTTASAVIRMDSDYVITANFAADVGGGGGGGGGGGAASSSYGDKTTASFGTLVSPDGKLIGEILAESYNSQVTLVIARNTMAKNRIGNGLTSVSIVDLAKPDVPQEGAEIIGKVYEFSPKGASFDPAVKLTIKYTEDELPEGITEDMLCIALWDEETLTYTPVEFTIDMEHNLVFAFISHFSRYTILAAAKPAAFTVSDLAVSPESASAGSTINVSVTVTNSGDMSGTYTCDLKVNDVTRESKDVTLGGGEKKTLSFTVSAKEPGTYRISTATLTRTFTVNAAEAAFVLSGLAMTPAEPEPGQDVTISATVTNKGNISGTYEVRLNINSTLKETKSVTLGAGESRQVSFSVRAVNPGRWAITIGDLSGELMVKQVIPPTPTPEPSHPAETTTPQLTGVQQFDPTTTTATKSNRGMIGGIAGGAIIVAGAIMVIRRNRKPGKRQQASNN